MRNSCEYVSSPSAPHLPSSPPSPALPPLLLPPPSPPPSLHDSRMTHAAVARQEFHFVTRHSCLPIRVRRETLQRASCLPIRVRRETLQVPSIKIRGEERAQSGTASAPPPVCRSGPRATRRGASCAATRGCRKTPQVRFRVFPEHTETDLRSFSESPPSPTPPPGNWCGRICSGHQLYGRGNYLPADHSYARRYKRDAPTSCRAVA